MTSGFPSLSTSATAGGESMGAEPVETDHFTPPVAPLKQYTRQGEEAGAMTSNAPSRSTSAMTAEASLQPPVGNDQSAEPSSPLRAQMRSSLK